MNIDKEKRFIYFYPEKSLQKTIPTKTRLKGVNLKLGETYRAVEILESDIFKVSPKLKKTSIVIEDTGVPARYDLESGNIYISPTAHADSLPAYIDHELQHKHDVEELGLFSELTSNDFDKLESSHEKRAYITTLRTAIERGASIENLKISLERLASGLGVAHRDHTEKILLAYLDEASRQASLEK